MYSAELLTANIKARAKEKKILIRDMLEACGLSINAISQITDKKGLSSFALAKIADHLDCSVDYLLGRTDNPAVNKKAPSEDGAVIPLAAYDGSTDTPAFSSQDETDAASNLNT